MRTLHLGLRITDRRRSVAFYEAVGYRVVGEVADAPIGHLTMLQLPGDDFVTLELVNDPATPLDLGTALSHFVIQVESLTSTLKELHAHGIEPDRPVHREPGAPFTAHLTDPDGHRIELVEWPAGHPDGLTAADWRDVDSDGSADGRPA